MDGRKLLWLGGIFAAGLTGCLHRQTAPEPYGSQAAAAPVKNTKPGREIDAKPTSLVKIAQVHAQVAIDESRPAEQRQQALQQAKYHFELAARRDPSFLPAYVGMAQLCSLCGEHDNATRALDNALAKAPNDASLWHERGLVMGRQKRFDEALNNFVQAHRLDPANTQYVKSVGLMHARMGRADEGSSWLMRAMSEADAHYNVAKMMQHIGRSDEARRQFQLALQAEPNHAATFAALGVAPPAPATPAERAQFANHSTIPQNLAPLNMDAAAPALALPERPAPAPAAPKAPSVKIGFEPGN